MVADKFLELQAAVGPIITRNDLLLSYQGLLKDTEAEVRAAAAGKLADFSKNLDKEHQENDIMTAILPCVNVSVFFWEIKPLNTPKNIFLRHLLEYTFF